MTSLLSELNKVMRKNPDLSLAGFRTDDYVKRSGATFEEDRCEMPKRLDAFLQSLTFLQMVSRQRAFNYQFTTYSIKHFVERWSNRRGEGVYVPEGILIAAALACGFKVIQRDNATYTNANLDTVPDGFGIRSGKLILLDS